MRNRWVICSLLFAGATINYVDRQVLAVLKPTLQAELGWSEVGYGHIVTAFQAAYAVGMLLVGRFIDRVGARAGLAATAAFWALATMAHAAARGVLGFSAARAALGLGEAGLFPAGGKAIAEHFPQRERSLAMGLLNAGTNVGPIACPLLAPWLVSTVGWRGTFVAMGALALAWIAPWRAVCPPPRPDPRPAGERELWGWRRLLAHREAWAIALAKLITDPVWWLYLFWIPDFLHRAHGLDLRHLGPPLVAIYALSFFGGIAGGGLSSRLLRRGWSPNAARKTAMLVAAVAVLPILRLGAARGTSLWTAVGILGLAVGAHQAFSANLLTLPSDLFPLPSVASMMGLGGMGGAIGGIVIAQTAGHILELTGSYHALFVMAAAAYFVALGLLHALSPRLAPVARAAAEAAA
ncbi:MAG TPA: MFS transporter [Polyangia bacterium]|nr:MFS transporter [Polyangia bacterium]